MPDGVDLQFRDAPAGGQECELHHFWPQAVETRSLRFAEFAAPRGLNQRRRLTRLRRPWLHARLHNSARPIAQIAYFNILACPALQTAEELR